MSNIARSIATCLALHLLGGCSSSSDGNKNQQTEIDTARERNDAGSASELDGASPSSDGDGASSTGGSTGSSTGGAGGSSTGSASDGGASVPDAGTTLQPKAGNPDGKCSQPLPTEAKAVDVSKPTTVVGTGSAASCTFDALRAAVANGGIITFACGSSPTTINVTATLELRTDRSTVIDGGNTITLDGGGKVRIMSWRGGDWQKNTNSLTLQHIVIANGKATGTQMIPTRPAPCSQGFNDGQGGALYMRDGSLRAIDVTFIGNRGAELGPDTGGGALYLVASKPAYIASCTFKDNKASNGGAMGSLFVTNFIYDSLFDGNAATGTGANDDDASMCSYMNNGQNQIGSGGNGGSIYSDGVAADVNICGTQVRSSNAGAFGAAIFFTSNSDTEKGTLTIRDSLMFNNVQKLTGWQWKPGISTNAITVEPINSDIRK